MTGFIMDIKKNKKKSVANPYAQAAMGLYYASVGLISISAGISLFIKKQAVDASEMFGTSSLKVFFESFYPWAVTICGSLAIIVVMYAGYLYVGSAGRVDEINKAKEYIIGTLTGLAFLILSGLIFQTLRT